MAATRSKVFNDLTLERFGRPRFAPPWSPSLWPATEVPVDMPQHVKVLLRVKRCCPLPQANEFNRDERFNRALFRKLGADLGLIGITASPPLALSPSPRELMRR